MSSIITGQDNNVDRDHIWHPYTSFTDGTSPLHIARGEGLYLYTSDGRKIMDAISSWWVNLHGHANKFIAEAIAKQAQTLEHVIFAGFTHDPAIELTRNLLSVLPQNQQRVFFSDNGSTAVEVGIKMAMQFWFNQKVEKKVVIALEGSYHGDTFGAMSIGARSTFTEAFNPYLFKVEFLPVPTTANMQQVIESFTKLAQTGQVAAFVYEPLVQGAAGMVMYSPEHLNELLSVAAQHDIICVADEVFTGFGRTGKWFASHYMKNVPDIMCLSKGITGGTLPLGVTTCSERIVKPFISKDKSHTFYHGHSYTANPISCAAANASFTLTQSLSTWENIRSIERNHKSFVERARGYRGVTTARSTGTILAIELDTVENTSYFNDIRKIIYSYFLERDILLRPLGNVIYILPPYIITEAELHHLYENITQFVHEMASAKESSLS